MNRTRAGTIGLSLLAATLLVSGCDRDGADTDDVRNTLREDAVTLDGQTGSVNLAPKPALAISPTDATVSEAGDAVVFTASGGTPPYTWGVGNPANGAIDPIEGNPCVYTCILAKKNSVYIKDSRGNARAATITVVAP